MDCEEISFVFDAMACRDFLLTPSTCNKHPVKLRKLKEADHPLPDRGKGISNSHLEKPMHKRARRDTNLEGKASRLSRVPQKEKHIDSERQRRSSMNDLLTTLRSLLPASIPRTIDKCTLISESIDHIHYLHKTLEQLKEERNRLLVSSEYLLKDEMLCSEKGSSTGTTSCILNESSIVEQDLQAQQEPSAQVQISTSESEVFITLTNRKKQGFWPAIMQVLEEEKLDIINCSISTCDHTVFYAIHAKADTNSGRSEHTIQRALQNVLMKP